MENRDKIRAIIDKQIEKLYQISETSKLPLLDKDIKALTELAKLVENENSLNNKKESKVEDLTPEELLLIYNHRKSKENDNTK